MKKALFLVCITALATLSGCKLTNWFCGSKASEQTEEVEKAAVASSYRVDADGNDW